MHKTRFLDTAPGCDIFQHGMLGVRQWSWDRPQSRGHLWKEITLSAVIKGSLDHLLFVNPSQWHSKPQFCVDKLHSCPKLLHEKRLSGRRCEAACEVCSTMMHSDVMPVITASYASSRSLRAADLRAGLVWAISKGWRTRSRAERAAGPLRYLRPCHPQHPCFSRWTHCSMRQSRDGSTFMELPWSDLTMPHPVARPSFSNAYVTLLPCSSEAQDIHSLMLHQRGEHSSL